MEIAPTEEAARVRMECIFRARGMSERREAAVEPHVLEKENTRRESKKTK